MTTRKLTLVTSAAFDFKHRVFVDVYFCLTCTSCRAVSFVDVYFSALQVHCYSRQSETVVKGRARENQNVVTIHDRTRVIQKPSESLQKTKNLV